MRPLNRGLDWWGKSKENQEVRTKNQVVMAMENNASKIMKNFFKPTKVTWIITGGLILLSVGEHFFLLPPHVLELFFTLNILYSILSYLFGPFAFVVEISVFYIFASLVSFLGYKLHSKPKLPETS
jgi:hypothetical protein